jgi:hypothetical protein
VKLVAFARGVSVDMADVVAFAWAVLPYADLGMFALRYLGHN